MLQGRLQAISQMPQQNYTAGDVKHPTKVLSVSSISHNESAEVLQPGKQPFNLPTSTVPSHTMQILCSVFSIAAARSN